MHDEEETEEIPRRSKKQQNRQKGREWRQESNKMGRPVKRRPKKIRIPNLNNPEDYLDYDY